MDSSKLRKALKKSPKYVRFSMPGALPVSGTDLPDRIQEKGGDYGAGLIKQVSVLCRGEALGHGLWCDSEMLSQTADFINASDNGIKSRFTHPTMSADGLAKFMGRSKNAEVQGDKVVADKHFVPSAHETPDGDLASYVMKRAKEDPTSLGTSIVFEHDTDAEEEFLLANGAQWKEDDDGDEFLDLSGFKSPDPENVNNYPHTRVKELRAVDFVDDPAANPDGLFHKGDEIAAEAGQLVAFALKLPGAERPETTSFDVDPDRLSLFVGRFLNQHGLEIVPKKKEPAMSKDSPNAGGTTAELSATSPKPPKKRTGKDFIKKFGQVNGALWFAEGKSWAQAQALHRKELEKRALSAEEKVGELTTALKTFAGGDRPVSFCGEQTKEEQQQSKANQKFHNKLPGGLARFAAGITLPDNVSPRSVRASKN